MHGFLWRVGKLIVQMVFLKLFINLFGLFLRWYIFRMVYSFFISSFLSKKLSVTNIVLIPKVKHPSTPARFFSFDSLFCVICLIKSPLKC